MINLRDENLIAMDRHSSKGNQLKFQIQGTWYKADGNGYEGLAEYVCSKLLDMSNLKPDEYVIYETCEIGYKYNSYKGCSSSDFLQAGWRMITLERLFKQNLGKGLNECIYSINNEEERLKYIVNKTEEITSLTGFGQYITKLLENDMFFLNEDRHTHNIAVLMDDKGTYHLCPIFDNGAALLSDTTMDYPLNVDVYKLIPEVKSKLFSKDIELQAEIAQKLYGSQLKFKFKKKDVDNILLNEKMYSDNFKNRVRDIIFEQMRRYEYLFQG